SSSDAGAARTAGSSASGVPTRAYSDSAARPRPSPRPITAGREPPPCHNGRNTQASTAPTTTIAMPMKGHELPVNAMASPLLLVVGRDRRVAGMAPDHAPHHQCAQQQQQRRAEPQQPGGLLDPQPVQP